KRSRSRDPVSGAGRSSSGSEAEHTGAGRICGGGESHPQFGCDGNEGLAMVERDRLLTRRYFFGKASAGLGIAALSGLLREDLRAADSDSAEGGLPGLPHFAPTAKRVIFLFQSGAPSQMDLFAYNSSL